MLVLASALLACDPVSDDTAFVEPFDGATSVGLESRIEVHVPDLDVPEGQAVSEEVLRVVDLADGGLVQGQRVVEGTTVVFEPTGGWAPDADYGWALIDAPDQARQPVLEIPDFLLGEAVFSTRSDPWLLDAVLDGGQLCLLFSEAPGTQRLEVQLDGGDVVASEWTAMFLADPGGGPDGTAACLVDVEGAEVDDVVRWTEPDGGSQSVGVVEGSVLSTWRARHRWVRP